MITFGQLLSNISKGQAASSVKTMLVGLDTQYQKIKNQIVINGCKKETDSITAYLLIPSVTHKKIYYDVAIWAKTQLKIENDTEIKVYSNSSSFAYNFAYIFHINGSLLFPEKFPKEFRELPPKVRNPFGLYGFDRQVYGAFKFIFEYGLQKIVYEYKAKVPIVKSFEEKQLEIADLKKKI